MRRIKYSARRFQREIDKTVNASKGRYMMRNLTRLGQAYYMGYHEYYDGDYRIALQRAEKGEQLSYIECVGPEGLLEERHEHDCGEERHFPQDREIEPPVGEWAIEYRAAVGAEAVGLAEFGEHEADEGVRHGLFVGAAGGPGGDEILKKEFKGLRGQGVYHANPRTLEPLTPPSYMFRWMSTANLLVSQQVACFSL